jgi:hypothetical protein
MRMLLCAVVFVIGVLFRGAATGGICAAGVCVELAETSVTPAAMSVTPAATMVSAPACELCGVHTTQGSVPLSLAGDVGHNVRLALDANGGALKEVVIPPGATWSFNAAVGNPAPLVSNLRSVAGVLGGGWCDLASRYVQAARPVLPPEAIRFPNHVQTAGIGLWNVANEDAVAIWNIDGQPGSFGGRQDLEITNTTDRPLRFRAVEGGGAVTIVAEQEA